MVSKVWLSFINLMTLKNKTVSKALHAELCENSTAGKCPLLYSKSNTLYCSISGWFGFVFFFFSRGLKKSYFTQRFVVSYNKIASCAENMTVGCISD